MSGESAASVVRRWMEHRDKISAAWRLRGSGFAIMGADGKRTENDNLTEWAKTHNEFTDRLRAAVREVMSPPINERRAREFVTDQLTDPLEIEGATELFKNMDWRGGWDGDIR